VPFVRLVMDDQRVIRSWFTEISDDNRSLISYFPSDLPQAGWLEFGYGAKVLGRAQARFDSSAVTQLDKKRVPKETLGVTVAFLRKKLGESEPADGHV